MKRFIHTHRALALLITIALLLSLLPQVISAFAADTVDDYTAAVGYAGGDGTKGNPYLISTSEQLALLAKTAKEAGSTITTGKYYKLTADISLNDTSADGWYNSAKEWTFGTNDSAGASKNSFCGYLDGGGHKISGLCINTKAKAYSGLFIAVSDGGSISNLGIVNSYIRATASGNSYAGPFAGARRAWNFDIVQLTGCYADETVTVEGTYTGGLIGKDGNDSKVTMTDCYSSAVLNGSVKKGGIFGDISSSNQTAVLKRCFNTQVGVDLTGTNPAVPAYEFCYTVGAAQAGLATLTADQMTGADAALYMSALDFTSDSNMWICRTGTFPTLAFTTPADAISKNDLQLDTTAPVFDTGKIEKLVVNKSAVAVKWPKAADNYSQAAHIKYTLYYSQSKITDVNASDVTVAGEYYDAYKGYADGLTTGEGYYFAVTAEDAAGNTALITTGDTAFVPEVITEDKWDGTVASEIAMGDGTKGNPYQINTAAELAYLANLVRTAANDTNTYKEGGYTATYGKYYELMVDIYLNDVSGDWTKNSGLHEWTYGTGTTGTQKSQSFAGNLDGNGHVIHGLYINENASTYSGLFMSVSGGSNEIPVVIKNLGIKDSYIRSTSLPFSNNYAGAIAGCRRSWDPTNLTISGCYVAETVTVDGMYAGGLIGVGDYYSTTNFSDCYSSAVINGTVAKGTFAGYINPEDQAMTFERCYHTQEGIEYVGNNPELPTYKLSYTLNTERTGLAKLTADKMKGTDALLYMGALDFTNTWEYNADSFPTLRIFNKSDNKPDIWDGTTVSATLSLKDPANTVNSADNPYLIQNGADLAYLVSNAGYDNTNGKYYCITNDIYLNDVTVTSWQSGAHEWTYGTAASAGSTNSFAGTLDGGNHIIRGLYINTSASVSSGLFVGIGDNAKISNLGIEDSYIRSTGGSNNYAGAIAGARRSWNPTGTCVITNCYSADSVTVQGNQAGGLIGIAGCGLNMVNCYSNAKLNGGSYGNAGGLVGLSLPTNATVVSFEKCYNNNQSLNSKITLVSLVGDNTKDGKTNARAVTYTNCYTTGAGYGAFMQLTIAQMTGETAKSNMTGLDFTNVWYTETGSTPKLRAFYIPQDTVPQDTVSPKFDTGKIELLDYSETALSIKWPEASDDYTAKQHITYTIYYSTGEITDKNVAEAKIASAHIDVTEGAVTGLEKGKEYYFAVAASDYTGNIDFIYGGPFKTNTAKAGVVWSGRTGMFFNNGTGTKDDPYVILTAEQLAYLAETSKTSGSSATKDKYYKLGADIILNDVSKSDWQENASEWLCGTNNSSNYGFCGNLDGSGHVIKGLYIADGASNNSGLFVSLDSPAQVSNLGFTDAYIRASHYAGTLAGVRSFDPGEVKVSGCFAADTVTVEASYTGGLLGAITGSNENVLTTITDCCSGAQLNGTNEKGGIVGGIFTDNKLVFKNCYATQPGLGLVGQKPEYAEYENCFASGTEFEGLTKTYPANMRGDDATKYMPGLDYKNVWKTVKGKTPVLRVFGNDDYGLNLLKVTISFVTNGGESLDPIEGYTGDKIDLPTPEREGYNFEGWYVYRELDIRYQLDTYPGYSLTLYAKWTDSSVLRQNFESYPYKIAGLEGLGEDYQYYRPGIAGYDSTYVHGGSKAIHRIGTNAGAQDFQLFDEESQKLEVGKKYRMKIWVYVDSTADAKGMISLVSTDSLDVSDTAKGVQPITYVGNLKKGKWQEISVDFTATGQYAAIRTPGSCSLYFDDAVIFTTDKAFSDVLTGEKSAPCLWAAAFVSSATAVAYLCIRRKRKSVNQ